MQHCPPLLNTSHDAHGEKEIASPTLHDESGKSPCWGLSNTRTTDRAFNRAAAESLQFAPLLDSCKIAAMHVPHAARSRGAGAGSPPLRPPRTMQSRSAGRSCLRSAPGRCRVSAAQPARCLWAHTGRGFIILFLLNRLISSV